MARIYTRSAKSRARQDRDCRWSLAVKERDDWKCRWCGADARCGADVQAAHIVSRNHRSVKYLLDNGLTLCNLGGCRTHSTHHSALNVLADERILKIVGRDLVATLRGIASGEIKEHNLVEVS